MSICLDFNSAVYNKIASLDCSKPYYNGIMLISPEILTYDLRPPYYGDTVFIGFYRYLGLEIGDLSSPIWALTPGYRYIYYVHRRTFVVYDENNTVLNSKDNIRSVGDMGISFEIYKSHQFIIMISTSDSRYPFYIPVHMDEYKWASSVIYDDLHGILNYYPGDSSRPYDANDVNNPSNIIHYMDGYVNIISGRSYIRDELSGIGDIVDHKYLLKSDIQFMNKILDPIVICNLDFIDRSIIHNWKKTPLPPNPDDQDPYDPNWYNWRGVALDISILLPFWSISIYPELMPIKMTGETINNRPVYEPWMIWQIMFITSRNTTDELNDHEVVAFDLSPTWA